MLKEHDLNWIYMWHSYNARPRLRTGRSYVYPQPAVTCSKLTIETLEQDVKCVQSKCRLWAGKFRLGSVKLVCPLDKWNPQQVFLKICQSYETKYSRMDQVKFFKGCLPQMLLGPFLNTLSHLKLHEKYNRVQKVK